MKLETMAKFLALDIDASIVVVIAAVPVVLAVVVVLPAVYVVAPLLSLGDSETILELHEVSWKVAQQEHAFSEHWVWGSRETLAQELYIGPAMFAYDA